ncbi:zinc finger protein 91-like [Chironomus tepperi]|uniref:zinc finger protein 91-like n=1 Tax=Chironomus tepperi TaxID=113505 RepID=UPI00391EFB4F
MNGQVFCELCGILVDRNQYERHKKYGHKEIKDNRCSFCDKTFTSSYNLQYHMAHHINARSFICNECPNAFNTAADLAQHQRVHDKGRAFECTICGMIFESRSQVNRHMKIHKKAVKKPYVPRKAEPRECPICEKTVMNLSKHNRFVHMNQRNFNCDFCDKKFGKKSGLDRHVLTVHKKEKNFNCEECGKAFGEKGQMTKHIQLVHLNEKLYNCELCDKKFGKKAGLDRHVLTVHKNVKNFKCEECGKAFGEKSVLTRHQKVHSSVRTSYYCTACKTYVDNIKNHYETVHADLPFECKHCFRRFGNQQNYNKHMSSKHTSNHTKYRKWQCDLCGSKFAEKYQIRRHLQSHRNAKGITKADIPQQNEIFNEKPTSSSEKSLKNSIDKKFACHLCGKKFAALTFLKFHLNRHQKKNENFRDICKIYDDNIKKHYEPEHKVRELHVEMVHAEHVKEEQSDDDYNYFDQGNDYSHISDCIESDIKPNGIEKVIVSSFSIKTEPNDLYDESLFEPETIIKCEPEDADTYDSEIADTSKEEEPEKIENTKTFEDEDVQEFKCNVCESLHSTKETFRQHFMSKHVEEKNELFVCNACNRTFKTKELIFLHVRRNHRKLKNQPMKLISVCTYCRKIFSSEVTLNRHVQAVHGEKRIPCTFCGKKFSFEAGSLLSHQSTHKKIDCNLSKLVCDHCGYSTFSKVQLQIHMLKHLKGCELHYCDICEKGFKTASFLHIHRKFHGKGDFACTQCYKKFAGKYEDTQTFEDDDDQEFKCNVCESIHPTKETFREHFISEHVQEKHKSFVCNACDKTYKTKELILLHVRRIHRKSTKLARIMNEQVICEVCGILVDSNKYERHKKYGHKENKDNRCNLCDKTFTSAYNLQYHMAHHINARSFLCNECPKAYNTAADLAQHQRAHDKGKDPFECKECKMFFEARSKFNVHMKTHKTVVKKPPVPRKVEPKECPICEKSFVSLSKHNQIVHMNQRNYDCEFCDKKFGKKSGLDRHVLTVHKKEKNFNCEECGKAFGEKAQLKKHERLHLFTYCARCKDHFEDIKQHNGEKHSNLKHSCESCFKVFERLRDLESHIKIRHSTVRSYFCDYCDKGFAEKIQIERHMKVHKKQFLRDSQIKKEEEIDLNELEDKSSPVINQEQAFNQYITTEVQIKEEMQDNDIDFIKYDVDLLNSSSPDEVDFKEELNSYEDDEFVLHDVNNQSDGPTINEDHKKASRSKKSKKEVKAKNVYKNYSRKEHGNKFICDICGSQFSYKFTARKHMESIHKKIRYECEMCNKTFTSKNTLYTHIKVVHQKRLLHECQFCKKKFGVKYALTKHIEIVHTENPNELKKHRCDLCGKKFSSYSGLYTHKKGVHEKVKGQKIVKYPCKICCEPFKSRHQNLVHSIQVHINGKKLKRICGYCKAEFELYDDFKTHIDSHVGLFICMICDKFYSDEESLKFHKDIHKEVDIKFRNYVCDHCGDRLLTKIQMKIHLRKHTKSFRLYYCDYCGKGFKFISSLYTHRIYHEEGRFTCTYCEKKFARNSELVQHIRSHTNEKPFKCEICSRRFTSKTLLKYHKQTHPETRGFKCRECQQVFVTNGQLATHENQFHPEIRSHFCFICNMSFKYEHNLNKHNLHKHN